MSLPVRKKPHYSMGIFDETETANNPFSLATIHFWDQEVNVIWNLR
jgi:hypothetical protein